MSDKLEILGLGIDFSNDFTQVCYTASLEVDEPVSMSVVPGEQKYLIPTVLYKSKDTGEWYIGDDAIARASASGEEYIDNIASCIRDYGDNATFNAGEESLSADKVISKFFEKLFELINHTLDCMEIHDVSVAIEQPDRKIIECVYKALMDIGFLKENIRVIDHAEAFIYYTTHQKRELWINDVALFDFSKDHFVYSRLRTIRNTNPKTISVEDTDYSSSIDYKMLETEQGKSRADKKFFQIIQENFRKSVVSAVYLTGSGFYEEWASESLPELCSKRRVFKGYNLFVKGSTYSAMKRYRKIDAVEYLFDCIGRTKVNVNLLIMHNGRNMALSLSRAGTNWYEAGAQAECILDDINKIQIIFEEPLSMMKKNMSIEVPGFPDRPNKATRVRISLAYTDDINCVVKVEDMGFGEFFKSSGMSIVNEINIEDLF